MDIVAICVSFIVAILGIAYPILFQVIAGLDEKYSSELILELFDSEKERKFFWYSIIASLASILIWTFKLQPLLKIEGLNFIIENSAEYLLGIFTLALIISFLFFVSKVLIYYTPSKFLKYLIKRYKSLNEIEYKYFNAIADILYFSIKKENETITKTVSNFLYWAFQNKREESKQKSVEYPEAFYEVVYKSIVELAQNKNKKLSYLEYRTIGGVWLLGELPGFKISEKTFNWLWRNLHLALEYESDDMIVYYWENAHRFFSYNLAKVDPQYSSDFKITNEKSINERNTERERFLEFHFALGGLLTYKQRYNCLNRIFKYTTSIPPKYELLPDSFDDILKVYIQFLDPYDTKYYSISHQYYFPKIEGLLADGVIKKWICEYIVLLFFRQYSIALNNRNELKITYIPTTQSKKTEWINCLEYLKTLMKNLQSNKDLISNIDIDFHDDNWFKDNQKPSPFYLIDDFKTKIESSFQKTQIEQSISQNKILQFNESTKSILKKTINSFNKINNQDHFINEFNSWFIDGDKVIMPKSAYAEDQEVGYLDFDSYLPERISNKYEQSIAETFFLNMSDSYLIKPEEIFLAIDKLKINSEFVIVGFAQNIHYFIKTLQIRNLTEERYKDIELNNFQVFNRRLFGQAFFIIKKNELPHFEFKTISNEQIKKYKLSEIDKEYKIYSSIIDLNSDEILYNELALSEPNVDLRKSVLVNISILAEIQWKKNLKNVLIKTYSPYLEQGLPNNLSDIKEF